MQGRVSAVVLLVAGLSATPIDPQDLPQGIMAVARALRHNRDLLKNVSDYTCLETISRERKAPKQRNSLTLDVVQADVAVGEGTEIYSWPGEASFSSDNLEGLVGQGFVATGFFDAFAGNIFVQNGAAVKFAGKQDFQGRPALRFTYVLSARAKWKVNWLGAHGNVGSAGEFWIDPKTFRLLRLDVHATQIPATLPLNAIQVAIDYKPLSIGNRDALIPSGAQILAVETTGTGYRDMIGYSQCHAFAAEATLSASPVNLKSAVQTYEAHRLHLPAGLKLRMALETRIQMNTAKIGDLVRARLEKAVKLSPELTIPRGSVIEGRVRELKTLGDPPNTRELGIAFDEIDWPGYAGIFFGKPIQIEQIPGLSMSLSKTTRQNRTTMIGALMNTTTEQVWPAEIPGVATFFLTGSRVVPKHFRMTWRTEETQHR
ncbi:MAG: hypothetical protein ACRD6B_19730 [Bryobacteraceae bacterium]